MKPRLARRLRHELERRAVGRDDAPLSLLDWARHFLPHHTERPFSPLHRWLAAELDQADQHRGRKINLIGPRGAAKSTLATLAYPLRSICRGAEPYIWIISDTKSQAETHLENLREELRGNRELIQHYGAANLERRGLWTANKIQLANGTVCESYGTGQRIRGRRRGAHRPTLVVCDDLQNDSHIYSPLQRSASRAWFHGTLLKAGRAGTNIVNVGTALHREALAVELLDAPGWRTTKFAAIRRWPDRMDLWHQWEAIYSDRDRADPAADALDYFQAHEAEMVHGAEVLWPEEEPLYALMKMRAESGHTAFEREKQNSPIDPERCEWPEDYFAEHLFERDAPHCGLKVLVLDPAAGGKGRRADFSAWVLLAIDAAGIGHVTAELIRAPIDQVVSRGVALALAHRPTAIGIEANLFDALLAGEWRRQASAAGLHLEPAHIHNADNKQLRIRRLGPLLAQRRLRFNAASAGARELVNQLRDFPIGDHDDGPDALEMAYRLADHAAGGGVLPPATLRLETR